MCRLARLRLMPPDEAGKPEKLNTRQVDAVEHRDGPLAVLAGPGTGKTRVIIHRIARLIREGAKPESIVALTFTVKAATELNERLRAMVGAAAADRVHAHTFHGFGQRLIRRFPDLLGLPTEPLLIDSAQKRRLARRLARVRGVFDGVLAEGMDVLVEEGLAYIAAFQHAGRRPRDCEAFARTWAERLERGEGDLSPVAREWARYEQARFARFVRLYAAFSEECRATGQLTYEDLILLSSGLLSEHPMAAAMCRSDYQHVVVDEFQDVNAGQIDLLRALCPWDAKSPPDLCVVGDDDQSIYLFRGADDRAFDKFARHWPGATTIPLTENYRSERPILDVAAAVIEKAQVRFAPNKTIEPSRETRARAEKPGAAVEGVEVADENQFGETIAAMIATDRARHPDRPWRSYAVIGRTYKDLDRIASALSLEDIPARISGRKSGLEDRGVQDVLKWMELLTNPGATWAAHWVLTRPPISLPAERAQEWLITYRAETSRHAAGEEDRAAPGGFTDWLNARHADDPGVRDFLELLTGLKAQAAGKPAAGALLAIIRRVGVLQADLADAEERTSRIAYLGDLVSFAQSRARFLDAPGDLAAFWEYFQDLEGEDEAFAPEAGERVNGLEAADDDSDAVTLLTAHKSKGLEFDTVFVPRVSPQHGFPKTNGADALELPEGFEDRAGDTRSHKERRLDEERRLFYVACTRAERRLVLLAKAAKSRSKSTHFFHELKFDHPKLITVRGGAALLASAEQAGVRIAGGSLPGSVPVRGRAEVLMRARDQARLDAARALDDTQREGAGLDALNDAAQRLRHAAARLAVVSYLDRHGAAPPWAPQDPATAAAAAELAATLKSLGEPRKHAPRGLKPPLRLSYTMIREYEKCPRCFYLRMVLGFPEDTSADLTLGQISHEALRAFFEKVRAAEAEGQGLPDLAELLRMGRAQYFTMLPQGQEADADQLSQLDGMLRNVLEKQHRPQDEIEEIEFPVRFPYEHNGIEHAFTAKFDRLDRWPAGGHRIIDYKTGRESKKLLEPKKDDTQLGVYALALRHHQGIPLEDRGTPARGVAEYWHLPTGCVGRIDLSAIDYGAIRKWIGKAVDGMLAGDFEPKKGCEGICSLLGDNA